MKRRTFVALTASVTSSPVWAAPFFGSLGPKGELLETGYHHQLFANKSYRLPSKPSLFDTLVVSIDKHAARKNSPQILASDQKMFGSTSELTLDEPGTYTVQFLGPEMGWHFY